MSRSELYHAHNKFARKMGFPEIQAVSNVDFSTVEKFDRKSREAK